MPEKAIPHIRIEDPTTLRLVASVQAKEGHRTITQAARSLITRGAGRRPAVAAKKSA